MDAELDSGTKASLKTVAGRIPSLPFDQQAALIIQEGNGQGTQIVIEKTAVMFGRKGTDIVISDPEASRRHCLLTLYGDLAVVKDLNSANGTMINEKIVREAVLKPGDLLQIGTTVYKFVLCNKTQNTSPF